jgi:predicted TIM-barrel fold metal-dependent hydrolase
VEIAKSTNDFLVEAIEHHPKRFAGFAAFLDQLPVSINDLEKTAHVNAEMLLHL